MVSEYRLLPSWTLPFFPMRAGSGPRLTPRRARTLAQHFDDPRYVWQPLLTGDRALLAVTGHKAEGGKLVLGYNGHYAPYKPEIVNAPDFLKFDSGTLFDGVVRGGTFYPFECLALDGRSFKANTTEERVLMAFQMSRLLHLTWHFAKPTENWMSGKGRLGAFSGIIRKQANLPYFEQTSSIAHTQGWTRYLWR